MGGAKIVMPGQSSVEQWYKSLPPITQAWVTLSVLTAALSWVDPSKFGIETLCWNLDAINQLQFWRPFTSVAYFDVFPANWYIYVMLAWLMVSWLQDIETTASHLGDVGYLVFLGSLGMGVGLLEPSTAPPRRRCYLFPGHDPMPHPPT